VPWGAIPLVKNTKLKRLPGIKSGQKNENGNGRNIVE
jgi:hypothetical protein